MYSKPYIEYIANCFYAFYKLYLVLCHLISTSNLKFKSVNKLHLYTITHNQIRSPTLKCQKQIKSENQTLPFLSSVILRLLELL